MLLAYETGVHIGDGNLYLKKDRMYRVTYSGNLRNEKEYYRNVLRKILYTVYGVEPCYYERKHDNTVLLILNSKEIVKMKIKLGIRPGNKNEIAIPAWIKKNTELSKACIRGIGDTDFSLSFKKDRKGLYKEPRIELYSRSKALIDDIADFLSKLEFTFSVEEGRDKKEFRLRMYGKRNLFRWVREIGFWNPYKNLKLLTWKIYGYCNPGLNYTDYLNLLRSSWRKTLLQPGVVV